MGKFLYNLYWTISTIVVFGLTILSIIVPPLWAVTLTIGFICFMIDGWIWHYSDGKYARIH